jgi:hypothetical protein
MPGVEVKELKIAVLNSRIIGTTPLIMHEFSEKSKRQMLEKQQKKAAKKKEIRNPEAEYEAAKIKDSTGKLAIKSIWIKKAIVAAARNVDDLPMTILRGAVFVVGDKDGLIPVQYEEEKMVEDVVRLSGGTSDLRYRPYLYGWYADVQIEYNADVLSGEQVANLLKIAGFAVGIGERRPGKSGEDYGRFNLGEYKE